MLRLSSVHSVHVVHLVHKPLHSSFTAIPSIRANQSHQ